MKAKLALFSLLVVLGGSLGVLNLQGTQEAEVPHVARKALMKKGIAPGFESPPKVTVRQVTKTVAALKTLEDIPEGVNLQTILEQLSTFSYDELDREWMVTFDLQHHRVVAWTRGVKSIQVKDGQTEIEVLNSLLLSEINGNPTGSAAITEVYRLLPNGELQLIRRLPLVRGSML